MASPVLAKLKPLVTAATGVAVRMASQMTALAVTLVAARHLGPTDFGIFAIALVVITLIRTMLYSGPYEFLLKSASPASYSTEALALNFATAGGLSVLAVIGAMASFQIFETDQIGLVILVLVPSNAISAFAAWQEVHLLRRRLLKAYYGVMLAADLVAGAAAVAMLFAGFKLEALVVQVYVRAVVNVAGYWLTGSAALSTRFSMARTVEILRWSLSRYAEVPLSFASQYSADVLLGLYLQPAAAGLYRAASRISTAVSDIVNQPLRMIGLTQFSTLVARHQPIDHLLGPMIRVTGLVSWSALALFAAIADHFIPVILGAGWTASADVIPYLCAVMALGGTHSIYVASLVSMNLQTRTLAVGIGATVLQICVALVAAPQGPLAVAIGVLVVGICASIAYLTLMSGRFPSARWSIAKALMTSAVIAASVWVAARLALRAAADHGASEILLLAAGIGAGLAVAGLAVATQLGALALIFRHDTSQERHAD